MNDTQESLDLTVLEETFKAPHCESHHKHRDNKVCSHVPVAVMSFTCAPPFKVCLSHVIWATQGMENACRTCKESGIDQTCGECWTITPL